MEKVVEKEVEIGARARDARAQDARAQDARVDSVKGTKGPTKSGKT